MKPEDTRTVMFAEAEEKLNKALAEFEKAAEDFRKTRCFSYLAFVKASADRLLRASDEMHALKRELGVR